MRSLFVLGLIGLLMLSLPSLIIFGFDLLGHGATINAWLESRLNISHRVALALPAAVLLFCLPPLIILLYFLRLKRQSLEVPSTFLWKKSIEDLHVNRLMQWLRRNVLLLLQLLAVLFLIYAALGPRTHASVAGGRYYILIIDNSASMSATDVKPNRLEWAKAEALKEIDAATDADSGMLIVFNSTAEIRQSYTTNRDELRAAVRSIEPTQFTTNINEALTLAASRANPDRSTANESVAPQNPEPGKERTYVQNEGLQADIHLFSDGKFPAVTDFALANLSLNYHAPPSPEAKFSDNLAIIRFFAERDIALPGTVIARAAVRSHRGRASEEVKLKFDVLDGSGRLLAGYTKTLLLKIPPEKDFAEAEAEFRVPDVVDNPDLVFKAWIDHPGDALPHDDSAYLVFGQSRRARVLVVGPGNRVLRSYFDTAAAKKLADFVYISPQDWANPQDADAAAAREGKFDLAIFDRTAPAAETDMPACNTFFIGHAPPPYRMKPSRPDDPDAVLEEKTPVIRAGLSSHPLMRDLKGWEEIRVAEAFRLPHLPPRTPRLIEGDRDLVLLAALPRRTFTDLVLTFPLVTANENGPDRLWHSNWPMRPSFVIFLRRVLTLYGDVRDTNAEESARPGSIVGIRMRGAREALVSKPDRSSQRLVRGSRADLVFGDTDQLGVYTIEVDNQIRRVAVNLLDPLESDLAPQSTFMVGATTVVAGETRKQPRELWKYFVLGGLLVVLMEWWIYNRRVQI